MGKRAGPVRQGPPEPLRAQERSRPNSSHQPPSPLPRPTGRQSGQGPTADLPVALRHRREAWRQRGPPPATRRPPKPDDLAWQPAGPDGSSAAQQKAEPSTPLQGGAALAPTAAHPASRARLAAPEQAPWAAQPARKPGPDHALASPVRGREPNQRPSTRDRGQPLP